MTEAKNRYPNAKVFQDWRIMLDKIGNWGSDTGQLYFEDVRVPVANTIGDIGRGFQQQMMQFQDERLVGCVSSIPLRKKTTMRSTDTIAKIMLTTIEM